MSTGARKTKLGLFLDKLMEFFKDLEFAYPEERDLKTAIEYIDFAKKSNPRLVLDMFFENVYQPCHEKIKEEDDEFVISYAKKKIATQYNEILPALAIFDKYWDTMDESNQKAIWNHLKILCFLCEKAKDSA
jgi:hypothetical protein